MSEHQPASASPTLDDLAGRFSLLHHKVGEATANALVVAIDAGDILAEVRHRVPSWFHWLKRHRIPISTAKLYVQLAQHRVKIEAELHRLGDLSLRAARLIAGPRASRASSPSRSDRKTTLDKSTQLLVKAVLLVIEPGTNNIEAGHSEAIATLHVLYNMLVAHGITLSDIAISASKGTTQQRRKAA